MCARVQNRRLWVSGMLLLALGGVSLQLNRWFSVSTNVADGIAGVLYGSSIALLILGMRARRD